MERDWLVFGVGSPEPRFRGSRFNIGAAVVDLLADLYGMPMEDRGLIETAMVQCGENYATLVKPAIIPEMINDACALTKKVHYDRDSVVLVYGDPDYRLGEVKMKRAGGASGNKVIETFLSFFGKKEVVRIRVGMGRLIGGEHSWEPSEIQTEDLEKVISGIHTAAQGIHHLVAFGQNRASQLINKANKGRVQIWSERDA